MITFTPMEVERVHIGNSSHITPPLEDWWSDLDKLRWKASVIEHDTGVRIRLYHARFWINGIRKWRRYGVQVGSSSGGAYNFHECWTYLNGVDSGARQGARV